MKWQAQRDWAGWSLGWYPTKDDPRCLTVQHIRWYRFNLDVCLSESHDWRLSLITRRNALEEAQRRYDGLGPSPRASIENYGRSRA